MAKRKALTACDKTDFRVIKLLKMKKDKLFDLFEKFEGDKLNINQLKTIKGGDAYTGTSGCATAETNSGTPSEGDDCDCDDDDTPTDTIPALPPRVPS
jgi:hypothetical protein